MQRRQGRAAGMTRERPLWVSSGAPLCEGSEEAPCLGGSPCRQRDGLWSIWGLPLCVCKDGDWKLWPEQGVQRVGSS